MTWQWILVLIIEALAIAFLVYKVFLPKKKRPRKLQKPDVKAGDLLRKRRKS